MLWVLQMNVSRWDSVVCSRLLNLQLIAGMYFAHSGQWVDAYDYLAEVVPDWLTVFRADRTGWTKEPMRQVTLNLENFSSFADIAATEQSTDRLKVALISFSTNVILFYCMRSMLWTWSQIWPTIHWLWEGPHELISRLAVVGGACWQDSSEFFWCNMYIERKGKEACCPSCGQCFLQGSLSSEYAANVQAFDEDVPKCLIHIWRLSPGGSRDIQVLCWKASSCRAGIQRSSSSSWVCIHVVHQRIKSQRP